MWDNFNLINWYKKKPVIQPVQQEVTVTITDDDRRETIRRSSSGTKLTSLSSIKPGLDDDNSSEASTSLNFGFKSGSAPRRASSYSFLGEPTGSPKAGSDSYRVEGAKSLGGIPQVEWALRFTRLWPSTPGGPAPEKLQRALRKRSIMSGVDVEDEVRSEKMGMLCTCNECFAEAAGIFMSSQDQSVRKDGPMSPRGSDEKSTNTEESRLKKMCDTGVSTVGFDRGAYFRGVFRKAVKSKLSSLKMEPPDGSIFDPCPGNNSSTQASTSNSNDDGTTSSTTLIAGSSTPATNDFNFGSSPPPSSIGAGGFSLCKQTSPIAPTITTSACSTITSPSSSGSGFGLSTAPTMPTNANFGVGSPQSLSTTVTPSVGIPSFGSPSAPGQISFSSGGETGTDILSKPKSIEVTAAQSSGNTSVPAITNSEGFNFAPSSTTSSETAVSPPAFGVGTSAGTSATSISSSSDTVPKFGGFASPNNAGTSVFGANSVSISTASTGESSVGSTNTTVSSSTGEGFSYNKPVTFSVASNNSTTGVTPGTLSTTFSFRGSSSNQGGSAAVGTSLLVSVAYTPKVVAVASTNPPPFGSSDTSLGQTATPTVSASIGSFIGSTETSTVTSTTKVGTTASSNAFPFGDPGTLFGQTATPTTTASTDSFGSTFGTAAGTSNAAANSGFSFGGNTGSSGGFSFSGGANPATTISSLPTSPPNAFGGSAATTAFGSVTNTPNVGAVASTNPAPFGSSGTLFGATATPSTTASTGSFGSTFGSSGTSTAATSSGFAFGGGNTGSSGGFNFSGPATPAATTTSSLVLDSSPTGTFGGSGQAANFNPAPAFGSIANTNPATFWSSGNTFGQTASGSFGSVFGSSAAPPANTGFSFGGNTAPSQGAAPSTPFQFGQQASQGVPQGGFKFAAAVPTPSPGSQALFNIGTGPPRTRKLTAQRRLNR